MLVSSPRTWGCFYINPVTWAEETVFPTHVGVFLKSWTFAPGSSCLPHARGGVSILKDANIMRQVSSPRTWGCFYDPQFPQWPEEVFPTHVGVFLCPMEHRFRRRSLPHARGGVSSLACTATCNSGSSPRTWWCFLVHGLQFVRAGVFPTHVGVFPSSHTTISQESSLAHTCGGVSYRR